MTHRAAVAIAAAAVVLVLAAAAPAFAAEQDVGVNLADWLQRQLEPVFYVALAVGAIGLLFARRWATLAVFFCVALAVGVFVLAPEVIGRIAEAVGRRELR